MRSAARALLVPLLATLVAPSTLRAQEGDPLAQLARVPLPTDSRVTVGTLDNGITYYIQENQRPENRAELRLVVNAGSVLEDADQLGLAHLVEHMAFNGTEHFEKQELIDYLESIGMEFGPSVNAYTSFDETVYMLRVPTDDPEAMATGFQILEDWAHLVSFEEEEIDKERGVVIEEWRLGLGAGRRMLDQQLPILFEGSRYAERLPIGSREVLESFPHERLIQFYRDWYRPELMAVVAVGDFDKAEVEETIRERFSNVEPGEDARVRESFEVPGHEEVRFAIATDPEATSNQVAVTFKHPAEEETTVADFRRTLVERLYNGMLNARLQELRQQADPPFVFGVSNKGGFVRTSDMYQLFAVVQDGGIPRGLEALLTEAERVERHGFTATELERQKIELLRGLERAFTERENQESRSYAGQYVSAFLQGEPVPGEEFTYQAAQQLLPTIPLEEVNALAEAWITDANQVILVNAPEKEGVPVPTEAELLAVFDRVVESDIEPYEDEVSDAPLVAEVPAAAEVVEASTMEEVGVTEWTLANGVRVLLKPTDFKADEVVMRAYSWGGSSLAPDEIYQSADLSAAIVSQSGLGEFSMPDLRKQLVGKVAGVNPGISNHTESLSGSASPQDLETLFQLIYLTFTGPRRDEDAFGALREQIRSFVANRSASPQAAFGDTLNLTLSQYHPRRQPPSVELLDKLDLDEALDFYRERFADASDFTFVFVGAFDLETMRPLVETWLGGLPDLDREESWRDEGVRPPEGVVKKVVHKGIEPQSRTTIVFHGDFDHTVENRLRIRLMAEALQIRLREIMREDLGGTYGVGVGAGYDRIPEEKYQLRISFGSDPERVEELVGVLFDEVEKFRTEGPTAEEVQKVKAQELRSRETDLRENGWWANQLVASSQAGQDPAYLTDLSLIEAVTAEELQEGAARWLDMESYVQVSLFPQEEQGEEEGGR